MGYRDLLLTRWPRRDWPAVLVAATRAGTIASVAAFGLALLGQQAFEAVGPLSFFGIGLPPIPSPTLVIGAILGALFVTLLGATITTLASLPVSPASLLSGAGETFHPATTDGVSADG